MIMAVIKLKIVIIDILANRYQISSIHSSPAFPIICDNYSDTKLYFVTSPIGLKYQTQ